MPAHNDVLARVTAWAMEGHRAIKIEIDTLFDQDAPKVSMWCYDYDLQAGASIMPGDPLPDIPAMARERAAILAAELERLNHALEDAQ